MILNTYALVHNSDSKMIKRTSREGFNNDSIRNRDTYHIIYKTSKSYHLYTIYRISVRKMSFIKRLIRILNITVLQIFLFRIAPVDSEDVRM